MAPVAKTAKQIGFRLWQLSLILILWHQVRNLKFPISFCVFLHAKYLTQAGSQDGFIRLWKCGENFRSLTPILTVPACGFINALAFSSDGKLLIAGIGQEHRLGRWWRNPSAKNEILVIPLNSREAT